MTMEKYKKIEPKEKSSVVATINVTDDVIVKIKKRDNLHYVSVLIQKEMNFLKYNFYPYGELLDDVRRTEIYYNFVDVKKGSVSNNRHININAGIAFLNAELESITTDILYRDSKTSPYIKIKNKISIGSCFDDESFGVKFDSDEMEYSLIITCEGDLKVIKIPRDVVNSYARIILADELNGNFEELEKTVLAYKNYRDKNTSNGLSQSKFNLNGIIKRYL